MGIENQPHIEENDTYPGYHVGPIPKTLSIVSGIKDNESLSPEQKELNSSTRHAIHILRAEFGIDNLANTEIYRLRLALKVNIERQEYQEKENPNGLANMDDPGREAAYQFVFEVYGIDVFDFNREVVIADLSEDQAYYFPDGTFNEDLREEWKEEPVEYRRDFEKRHPNLLFKNDYDDRDRTIADKKYLELKSLGRTLEIRKSYFPDALRFKIQQIRDELENREVSH